MRGGAKGRLLLAAAGCLAVIFTAVLLPRALVRWQDEALFGGYHETELRGGRLTPNIQHSLASAVVLLETAEGERKADEGATERLVELLQKAIADGKAYGFATYRMAHEAAVYVYSAQEMGIEVAYREKVSENAHIGIITFTPPEDILNTFFCVAFDLGSGAVLYWEQYFHGAEDLELAALLEAYREYLGIETEEASWHLLENETGLLKLGNPEIGMSVIAAQGYAEGEGSYVVFGVQGYIY